MSTFLLSRQAVGEGLYKPVDKSVVKLWKELPGRRGYWSLAFYRLTVRSFFQAAAARTVGPGQGKNFACAHAGLVERGLEYLPVAPKDCGPACG